MTNLEYHEQILKLMGESFHEERHLHGLKISPYKFLINYKGKNATLWWRNLAGLNKVIKVIN